MILLWTLFFKIRLHNVVPPVYFSFSVKDVYNVRCTQWVTTLHPLPSCSNLMPYLLKITEAVH